MSVKLREKQMKNGRISFYLDIYHNKTRWYEFLEIHIQKNRPSDEDKEKRKTAMEIKTKRELELISETHGLESRNTKIKCFLFFMEQYKTETGNEMHDRMYKLVREFVKNRPIPFTKLDTEWVKAFERYMLTRPVDKTNRKISHNTTVRYLLCLNTFFIEANRRKLMRDNPYKAIPVSKRLKIQDIFRCAFSIEQLQLLANTPCDIDEQIKQAYFFSCFTGLRWSDVNPLRWDEIIVKEINEQTHYFIYFEQEKTEGIEYLPLSQSAVDIILARKACEENSEVKSAYVFPRVRDKEGEYKGYSRMSYALKKWADAVGIERKKLHFHTGRHSFATNVLENCEDGDLYTVSKLLGHKEIKSTQIYAKVRDKRKLSAVQALPRISFSF